MPDRSILVVDDSRTVRVQIDRILRNAGYDVILAEDGRQALDLLVLDPRLMVLDVVMPGMDGYGVCENLERMGEPFVNIPIVFLTSLESRALELLGTEYGAYLRKPVDAEKLLDAVSAQLQMKRSGLPSVQIEAQ